MKQKTSTPKETPISAPGGTIIHQDNRYSSGDIKQEVTINPPQGAWIIGPGTKAQVIKALRDTQPVPLRIMAISQAAQRMAMDIDTVFGTGGLNWPHALGTLSYAGQGPIGITCWAPPDFDEQLNAVTRALSLTGTTVTSQSGIAPPQFNIAQRREITIVIGDRP